MQFGDWVRIGDNFFFKTRSYRVALLSYKHVHIQVPKIIYKIHVSPARTVSDVERYSLSGEQTAFLYSDFSRRSSQMICRLLLDNVNKLLPVRYHSKNHVFAVQTRRRSCSDEKLTSVRIWAYVEKIKNQTCLTSTRTLVEFFQGAYHIDI